MQNNFLLLLSVHLYLTTGHLSQGNYKIQDREGLIFIGTGGESVSIILLVTSLWANKCYERKYCRRCLGYLSLRTTLIGTRKTFDGMDHTTSTVFTFSHKGSCSPDSQTVSGWSLSPREGSDSEWPWTVWKSGWGSCLFLTEICKDDEHFKPCQLSHLSVCVWWIRFLLWPVQGQSLGKVLQELWKRNWK